MSGDIAAEQSNSLIGTIVSSAGCHRLNLSGTQGGLGICLSLGKSWERNHHNHGVKRN